MIVDTIIFTLYKIVLTVVLPLIGVIILGRIAWKFWIHYIQADFISGIEYVMLEIVPPRDVLRSPRAMELFFTNALYHWSQKGGKEQYWQGAVWFWFSLEIASIEGQVHFYVRTPSRLKDLIETQMYAQYPQAQVRVVPDYTLAVDEISPTSKWMGWGCEFGLRKDQAFPIKTYVDFGLDKDPKEELKVDPISSVIELFGAIGKGEQVWLQIVVTPSQKMYKTAGTWFGYHDWVEEAKVQLFKVLAPFSSYKDVDTLDGVGLKRSRIEVRVPPNLEDVIKKMRTKPTKLGFETGIRLMYVAKKENYSMNTRRNIRLIFRQYAAPDSNEFWRVNATQGDYYSEYFGASEKTVMMLAQRMLHEYQERGFFHLPMTHHLLNDHTVPWPFRGLLKVYKHPPTFVLNTEELATIWHFPGQILKVPTLTRIESKEASPPPNLPT